MYLLFLLAAENSLEQSGGMNASVIGNVISATVAILGFVITNKSIKKNFINELKKQKSSIWVEKMSTIPYDTLQLYDHMLENGKLDSQLLQVKAQNNNIKNKELIKKLEAKKQSMSESVPNEMNILFNTIYAYGSEKAISIVSLMQQENYALNGNLTKQNEHRFLSCYALLATQVKYDVTELIICPELWFKMRIKDYCSQREDIKVEMNKLIDELKLNDGFKIK